MSNPMQLFDDPSAKEPDKRKTCTPAKIGTGPPGETCKSCLHRFHAHYRDKHYYKCYLMRRYWTHGGGSDIKLKWAACKFWEPIDFRQRVTTLGEVAREMVETCGWFREPLLVIAEHYEELGHDMGWLRFAALQVSPAPQITEV